MILKAWVEMNTTEKSQITELNEEYGPEVVKNIYENKGYVSIKQAYIDHLNGEFMKEPTTEDTDTNELNPLEVMKRQQKEAQEQEETKSKYPPFIKWGDGDIRDFEIVPNTIRASHSKRWGKDEVYVDVKILGNATKEEEIGQVMTLKIGKEANKVFMDDMEKNNWNAPQGKYRIIAHKKPNFTEFLVKAIK